MTEPPPAFFGRPPLNSSWTNPVYMNGRNGHLPPSIYGAAPIPRFSSWRTEDSQSICILDQDPHSFRSTAMTDLERRPRSSQERDYNTFQPSTDFRQRNQTMFRPSMVENTTSIHSGSNFEDEFKSFRQMPEQFPSRKDVFYLDAEFEQRHLPLLDRFRPSLIELPRPPEPPHFLPCPTSPTLQRSAGNSKWSSPTSTTPPRRSLPDFVSSRSPCRRSSPDYSKYYSSPRRSPDYFKYNSSPRRKSPDSSRYRSNQRMSPPNSIRRTSPKRLSNSKRRYSSSKKSAESRNFSSQKLTTPPRRSFVRTIEAKETRSKQRSGSSKSSSRSSVDKHAKEKNPKKNNIESELQEFAKQLDQEALFEKLKQNQLNRLQKQLLNKKNEREAAAAAALVVQTEMVEQTNEELEDLDEVVKNEIEEEFDVFEEVLEEEEKQIEENTKNGQMLPIVEEESKPSSPESFEETIEDSYPWYLGAPIQNEIYEKVARTIENFPEYYGRPQKPEDEFGCFPVKRREIVEKNINEFTKLLPNRTEILKENSDGVVIRRNGSTSWVSRKFIGNTTENNSLTMSVQASSSSSQLTIGSPRTNDCFEYTEKKSCKAGLLCQYDHGNGDHRLIKFCKRFMNGLCRNGDECPNGSHALLKHQMPVCDYFLRRTCFLTKEQCPFLHVKTSPTTPLCFYFNKGRCLAQPPCTFCHRYSPTLVRERCNDITYDTMESFKKMVSFQSLIDEYRHNRKLLLLIVYVALFLDNMLLTTVVPIIPEYLLRISHPNDTDILLNDKMPDVRQKRQISWDDAWDVPSPQENDYDDDDRPIPKQKSKSSSKSKSKSKSKLNSKSNKTIAQQPSKSTPIVLTAQQEQQYRHETLSEENVHVGLMFGSKALIQLITNPFVGPITNKIGYTIPMFTGFVIMFLSTIMFAFGNSFATLWFARALQGIGSACTSTSGMGMLAQAYPDDAERGSAMGIALGGLALGVLIGPPYGGVLYEWAGKELPFILLALLALGDGTLQFFALQPKIDRGEPEGSGIKELLSDPYIIVAAGSITIGNLGIAMLEPSLPLWMMESWQAKSFERGLAFLPASVSYLIGTNIFGPLAHKIGRWLSGFIGLVVIGFCLILIPSASSTVGLIIPNFCMGFSIGMIDASMFPMMGHIVDIRHVGVYGSIYAIADAAFCFAFALGPFFSGPLVRSFGFPGMMYLIAAINFIYAPLMFFLRKLPEIPAVVPQKENGTTVDGNALHYEKIDGKTSVVNQNPVLNDNYHYNIHPDWN